MARGNEGNLLQHTIECELARLLNMACAGIGLRFVTTHSMAPYEPCPERKENRRLIYWLDDSRDQPASAEEPAVVTAYRVSRASLDQYPNTGKLLEHLIGKSRLSGYAVEYDPGKFLAIQVEWDKTSVTPLPRSWREHVCLFQTMSVDRPWLFTMDPMQFKRGQGTDDDNLYDSDLLLLRPVFQKLLSSGHEGAIAIFSFSMMDFKAKLSPLQFFRDRIDNLVALLGGSQRRFLQVRRSNWDIAAVISTDAATLDKVERVWQYIESEPMKSVRSR